MTQATKPSSLETLAALLRVTEAQERHEREQIAERRARVVTSEGLLAAVKSGENTWERLHAYFPETEWRPLAQELEKLQREGALHRGSDLVFRAGARKHPWKMSGGESYEPEIAPSWYSRTQRVAHAKARGLPPPKKNRQGARPSLPPGTRRG
jgi:hypothetical protein